MSIITIEDATILQPGFLDSENPRSLINICPDEIREFILRITPNTFTWSESKLKREAKPDFTAKCLRINFWNEYVRAQNKQEQMKLGNILKGVTTKMYFLHLAESDPIQLAWVIIPPKSYNVVQAEIFEEALERMKETLELEPYDTVETSIEKKDGTIEKTVKKKVNTSLLAEKRKILEVMADRVQGALDKKVVVSGALKHTHGGSSPGLIGVDSLDAIDAEIEEIG